MAAQVVLVHLVGVQIPVPQFPNALFFGAAAASLEKDESNIWRTDWS